MSIVVRLSPGERFLNWMTHNTKLYIRGERGKSYPEQIALHQELTAAFNQWFQGQVEKEIQHQIKEGNLKRIKKE